MEVKKNSLCEKSFNKDVFVSILSSFRCEYTVQRERISETSQITNVREKSTMRLQIQLYISGLMNGIVLDDGYILNLKLKMYSYRM